jgi:alkanesulfonate monooxygenase SsuD/methylene tetrahydromethanopterin reductase-like flavin-dependent oxidoreductase (luciferase family)
MSREADRLNREVFEEAMEVITAAWNEDRFRYEGNHFQFPPPGIPDRGAEVTHLTLVPRPVNRPVEIFQPVTSPETLAYVARRGHTGVFANAGPTMVAERWKRFAEEAATAGRELGPGEGRCLQMVVHVGPLERARPGHDELVKFLSPYGRLRWFGEGVPFDFRPSLEETRKLGVWALGSVEEVADTIGRWAELLDLRHLVLFPELPGLSREEIDEQLHVLATDVLPRAGVTAVMA